MHMVCVLGRQMDVHVCMCECVCVCVCARVYSDLFYVVEPFETDHADERPPMRGHGHVN